MHEDRRRGRRKWDELGSMSCSFDVFACFRDIRVVCWRYSVTIWEFLESMYFGVSVNLRAINYENGQDTRIYQEGVARPVCLDTSRHVPFWASQADDWEKELQYHPGILDGCLQSQSALGWSRWIWGEQLMHWKNPWTWPHQDSLKYPRKLMTRRRWWSCW